MRRNTSPMVEGGLLVAITVILGVASVFLPILGMFVEFFCAVPIAVLTTRQGTGKGFTALFVTFILLSMLISPIPAVRLALSYGVCGIALGWCLRKNFNAVKIFFTILVVASAAQFLTLTMLIVLMDVNLIEMQLEMLRESFAESFSMYESMGVDTERIAVAKEQVEPLIQTIALIVPTLIMVASLAISTAVWLTAHWIFPKLQMKIPTLPPFAEWRFPSLFMYTAIIGGLGLYWGITRGWTGIQEISLNLLLVSVIIGIMQGFALLSAVFDRYKVSKFLRIILYVFVTLNMFLLQLVAITGLMDMIFDYRKRFFRN